MIWASRGQVPRRVLGGSRDGADGGASSDHVDTVPRHVTLLIVCYAAPPPALPSFLPSSASSVHG